MSHDETVWLHTEGHVSMTELADWCGLPEAVLQELAEYGATFGGDCVTRLRTAARLRNDLELETPALALALTFLERIQSLEATVRRLDAQLARPRR